MNIYKLGTKWGKGAPDFYDFIKSQKIALSHSSDCSPEKGSVVLIATGFTIKAITILREDVHPVTDNDEFEKLFEKYKIDFEDETTYARAKWIELKVDEQFSYQNQDGICQIHKPEIHLITENLIAKYMQQEDIDNIKKLLLFKKQIILQGPPGTGKTKLAKELAKELILPQSIAIDDVKRIMKVGLTINSISDGIPYTVETINETGISLKLDNGSIKTSNYSNITQAYSNLLENKPLVGGDAYQAAIAKYIKDNWKDEELCKIIQFHPSYSYEDFVRGIVAESKGDKIEYTNVNKIFGKFAKEAVENFELSKQENTEAQIDKWINESFNEFKDEIEKEIEEMGVEEKGIAISDKIKIFEVDNIGFRYGANWNTPLRLKFTDIKKLIKAVVTGNLDPNQNNISKEISVHAYYRTTYYLAVLRMFLHKHHFTSTSQRSFQKNYVLIIDEINRANLSSVLGELIYALEYRGEKVESMYAVDDNNELVIPPNLYIVGTMNTADRSVGHIDYAIRRRFAFVDVLPKDLSGEEKVIFDSNLFKKVSGLFISNYDEYSANNNVALKRAETLSEEFEPKDVWLGHSYFIDKSDDGGSMTVRLEYEIKPILMEYVKDGILIGQDIKDEIEKLS